MNIKISLCCDEIVKNNDEEKNIEVSDKLKARLNVMFEALGEEGTDCFVKVS